VKDYNGFSGCQRDRAQRWLNKEWDAGGLARSSECVACGQTEGVIQAHAEDYSGCLRMRSPGAWQASRRNKGPPEDSLDLTMSQRSRRSPHAIVADSSSKGSISPRGGTCRGVLATSVVAVMSASSAIRVAVSRPIRFPIRFAIATAARRQRAASSASKAPRCRRRASA
jgi:hypothetical protein